jgi:hypothetical protein
MRNLIFNILASQRQSSYIPVPSTQPDFWFDFTDPSYQTSTLDNLSRIIDSFTSRTGSLTVTARSGSDAYKPSYNGEGVYFNKGNSFTAGTTSTFNQFHNGGLFTQYYLFKYLNAPTSGPGSGGIIAANNTLGGASVGFALHYDNRASASRTNAIALQITKGVSGQVPISIAVNNALSQGQYHLIKITYDGTSVRLYVDDMATAAATANPAFTFVTSNANNVLSIGDTPAVSNFGAHVYMKHILMFESLLGSADQAAWEAWLAQERNRQVPIQDANIYFIAGQSNAAGRGVNSSIAGELDGKIGARIFRLLPSPPVINSGGSITAQSFWEECELGVNQSIESAATQHGFEMRFGYEMWQASQNIHILKLAIGGTTLVSHSNQDWNVASSSELYSKLTTAIANIGLEELIHVFRKNPVIRGFIWMQGETDVIYEAGAEYKANLTDLMTGFTDYVEGLGYSMAKCRWTIFRIHNHYSEYDPTNLAAVRLAQEEIGDDFLEDNPSYETKCKSTRWVDTDEVSLLVDNLHFDTEGLDGMGEELAMYYANYLNE